MTWLFLSCSYFNSRIVYCKLVNSFFLWQKTLNFLDVWEYKIIKFSGSYMSGNYHIGLDLITFNFNAMDFWMCETCGLFKVYTYIILYVFSLFCCHACIMQYGLHRGYLSLLIFPQPCSFVPGFHSFPSYMGTYQLDSPLAISLRPLSPDGPWQTLHWGKITAFIFVLLITLSLFHVHEWWFQNKQKLGK